MQKVLDFVKSESAGPRCVTTGGTESIILACKAYRDKGREAGIEVKKRISKRILKNICNVFLFILFYFLSSFHISFPPGW